jgi:AcrR family transcriptional regulator
VARKDSMVKQHILSTTAAMISDGGSEKIRIVDIAREANVGVPTIYYHFDSRAKLMAEAQVARYVEAMEPQHSMVIVIEDSIARGDETEFWRSITEFVASTWSPVQISNKFEVGKMLMDEAVDPFLRQRFLDVMEEQYRKWLGVVRAAQSLGWIVPSLNAEALTSLFWSASVGQMMTTNAAYEQLTPDMAVELFNSIVRA